jgi:hypothetical protein
MSSRTRLGLSLATTVLLALMAGCDSGSNDSSAPPDESSQAGPTSGPQTSGSTDDPTDGPTDEPTSAPSTSEFTQGPPQDPNGSTAARAKASQIPAEELPGLNDTWTWEITAEGKGSSGDSQPSLCMQAPLESIGAASTYRTDYNHPGVKTARASVITAVFPDQHTAVLAKTVLRSWHAACEERLKKDLGYRRVSVSPIQRQSTEVGPGEAWLSAFGPVKGRPDDGWFQGEGFVEDADTLTYVVIVSTGQDYNYERGQQPAELAVAVAAEHLKASRT